MRTFGPKTADHPSVGKPCPLCKVPFKEGDMTCLVPMEPTDPDAIAAKKAGRSFITEGVEVHAKCLEAAALAYLK